MERPVAKVTSSASIKGRILTLEISAEAREFSLFGRMVYLRFRALSGKGDDWEPADYILLGQIVDVIRENSLLEGDVGRQALAMGRSGLGQDLLKATLEVQAAFKVVDGRLRPTELTALPPTGTPVLLVDEDLMSEIAKETEDPFYLGYVLGTDLPLPLSLPDMRREGYAMGIFGRTGSGKSALAKALLAGYARRKGMGILVLDPQGEFALAFRDRDRGSFALPLGHVFREAGREVWTLRVGDLALNRWEVLRELLIEEGFFQDFSMTSQKAVLAASFLVKRLKEEEIPLEDLAEREAFERVLSILKSEEYQTLVYQGEERRNRVARLIDEADPERVYRRWQEITLPFAHGEGRRRIEEIADALGEGKVVVLDLLEAKEGLRLLILEDLLREVGRRGEEAYRKERLFPLLIVLDEAHRLVPGWSVEGRAKRVKGLILDGVRTGRKQGIGWLFISQTLGSLEGELLRQLRFLFVGYGVGMGVERDRLREIAGEEALSVYDTFRDPETQRDGEREHAFMLLGPLSPLSALGRPLFLKAYSSPKRFLESNGHHET